VRVGAPLDLGVRAINTFTTVCEGQRLGIFAGSGVGKSVLMSMLALNAQVDVAVIVREVVDSFRALGRVVADRLGHRQTGVAARLRDVLEQALFLPARVWIATVSP